MKGGQDRQKSREFVAKLSIKKIQTTNDQKEVLIIHNNNNDREYTQYMETSYNGI